MRCGELASIKPENLDFEKHIIYITNTVAYRKLNGKMGYFMTRPKTKTSIRRIPMSEMFCDAVKNEMQKGKTLTPQLQGSELEGIIFITEKGYPISPQSFDQDLKKLIREINEKQDIQLPPFSSHSLRHTFCTRLIEKNLNPKYVQTVMGHSSIRQTMERYAHTQDEYLTSLIDEMNDIF